jgi:hypothetical protein
MQDNISVHRRKTSAKRKPLGEMQHDKENSNAVNIRSSDTEDGAVVKKFKMSADEKHMNGAPEGELYDITVLKDSELKRLEGTDDEIVDTLRQTLADCSAPSSSWADRFAAVEVVRRMTLTPEHARLLEDDYVLLVAALESCTHALGSLRSCSVRNGLLAIESVTNKIPLTLELEHGFTLVTALMSGKLLTGGPKFISESATTLVEEVIKKMDPLLAIECLRPSTDHKNPHVSDAALCMASEAFIRVSPAVREEWRHHLSSSSSSSSASKGKGKGPRGVVCDLLLLLHKGLSAKWPKGRALSRQALYSLRESLGDHPFDIVLGDTLSDIQVIDVHRELRKVTDAINAGSIPFAESKSCFATSGSEFSAGKSSSSSSSARGGKGQGLSRTVPYPKDESRLTDKERSASKVSSSSPSSSALGASFSGGRMSLKDRMKADRRAFLEKDRRPAATSSGSSSSSNSNNNSKLGGPRGGGSSSKTGIFIFEDM